MLKRLELANADARMARRAAQYLALDYRVCSRGFRSADIKLLHNAVSEGRNYYCAPDYYRGLTVEVVEQSDSLGESGHSFCNDYDYQQITENLWTCKASSRLTRETPFYVPEELTPEQQAKHMRWQHSEEEMKSAGLTVAKLHSRIDYVGPTPDSFKEQKQLARDRFLVAEEEYKQALTDFKSSL